MEKTELQRLKFELKKYKAKPNITYASGIHRQNKPKPTATQAAMNVYVSVNHHYNNNKELKGSAFKDRQQSTELFAISQEFLKSRSNIVSMVPRKNRRELEEEVGK